METSWNIFLLERKNNPKHQDLDLRHDPWQMEDLGREVSHVAVEENKQGLDDSGVRGETGSEGAKEAVDGSHQDASQRDHKETDHTQEGIHHSHSPSVGKLLEEVIQNLHREKHKSSLLLSVCPGFYSR